jgi:hypothetical protein
MLTIATIIIIILIIILLQSPVMIQNMFIIASGETKTWRNIIICPNSLTSTYKNLGYAFSF